MDVLKNKTYKQYDRLSRYSNFPYYYNTLDNKFIYGTTKYLDDTTPYVLVKVKDRDTYDSLALDYYNNPTYFWIICSYNHIQDPFKTPKVGSFIKIPILSTISYEWSE